MVLWCACKVFGPDSQEVLCVLRRLDGPSNKQDEGLCRRIKGVLANQIAEYLPLMDFCYLSVDYLLDVVQPFGIIPISDMRATLDAHKLQPLQRNEEQTLQWVLRSRHYGHFQTCKDPCQIKNLKNEPSWIFGSRECGWACYNFSMGCNAGGVFEWDIVIDRVCENYVEIGILRAPGVPDLKSYRENCEDGRYFAAEFSEWTLMEPYRFSNLSTLEGCYALRMNDDGASLHRNGCSEGEFGKDCSQLVYGKDYGHKKSRVKISYNALQGTCSVGMDGEDFGMLCTKLEKGTYYPAVSMGAHGKVHIEILKSPLRKVTSKATGTVFNG